MDATESDTIDREAIRRSCRTYAIVGAFLFAGTIATYCVATIPALDVGRHGFDGWDCAVGLLIASMKASAVALIFMHLNHEKRLIYFIAVLSCLHAGGLAMLLALAESDRIHNPYFNGEISLPDPGGVSVSQGPFPQTEGAKQQQPASGNPSH